MKPKGGGGRPACSKRRLRQDACGSLAWPQQVRRQIQSLAYLEYGNGSQGASNQASNASRTTQGHLGESLTRTMITSNRNMSHNQNMPRIKVKLSQARPRRFCVLACLVLAVIGAVDHERRGASAAAPANTSDLVPQQISVTNGQQKRPQLVAPLEVSREPGGGPKADQLSSLPAATAPKSAEREAACAHALSGHANYTEPPTRGGNRQQPQRQKPLAGTAAANQQLADSLTSQQTQLVPSRMSTQLMLAPSSGGADPLVASASKKKKKMKKMKKKMEKKHKEWKKGKKHKKKKYESKKKKGGMMKKKKGKKMKKKWGEEKKGHKKKGDFKKKKWGHKKKMKKGQKKGKKGHKKLMDKGHKKKGFKKVYHKEEWGKKKKWHDIKREKKWNTKQKKWKKKWAQEKGKKYKGKHMKKYHKKNKHGKKYKKEKKEKYKKHKGEKFKKGHKKKKEEYSKKKEGGKKKKMKKEMKKMKKKKG